MKKIARVKKNEKSTSKLHPAVVTSPEYFGEKTLIITAQSEAEQHDLDDLANWEMRRRNGERYTWTYTLQGWAQNYLWEPGTSVEVRDDSVTAPETLLIKSVTYTIDEGGTSVTLELVDFDAYAYKNVTNNEHAIKEHRARDKETAKKAKAKKLAAKINKKQAITPDEVLL